MNILNLNENEKTCFENCMIQHYLALENIKFTLVAILLNLRQPNVLTLIHINVLMMYHAHGNL